MTPAALDRDYNYLTTVEKALNHTPVGPFSNGGEEKEHTSRMERVINEVQHRGTQVIQAPAGLKRARENMTVVTG